MRTALCAVLVACGVSQDVEGFTVGAGGELCGAYTFVTDSGDACGSVFLCDLGPAFYRATPEVMHTTTPELCWIDDNAQEIDDALGSKFFGAACEPSPRGNAFGWPCLYHCGGVKHSGCNAYQGCYCS